MIAAALKELIARIASNDDSAACKKLSLHYCPKLLTFSNGALQKKSSEKLVADVFGNVRKILTPFHLARKDNQKTITPNPLNITYYGKQYVLKTNV